MNNPSNIKTIDFTPKISTIKAELKNQNAGNIFAVIVTYGNRGSYVSNVCKHLLAISIQKIIIIDNNSTEESKQILRSLKNNNNDSIIIEHSDENKGTAAAFKLGLNVATGYKECDFIWILDDDNFPDSDALDELIKLWSITEQKNKSEMLMLVSYRKTKPVYKRAVCCGKPDIIIGEKNYFRAFHIAKIIECISRKSAKNFHNAISDPEYGDISAAPYGGMFFHKNLLNTIGYPNELFYIYSDDHDFSHRLILRGGRIILSLKSTLNDVEESWNARGLGVFNIAKHPNRSLLYYSIRNRVYLELKITVNNYVTYLGNAAIYTIAVFLISMFRFNFRNFLAFWRGFTDGLKGRMGINKHYSLR